MIVEKGDPMRLPLPCAVGAALVISLFGAARADDAGSFRDPGAPVHRAGNLAAGRPYLLQPQPSALYPDRNERTLTDRERAAGDQLRGGWVGFDRGRPSITLDLDGLHRIDRITIGFLSSPSKGIHPPASARLLTSIDGQHWSLAETAFAPAPGEANIDVPANLYARYVRVALERDEWLFLDEVEVFGFPAPNANLNQPVKGIALITDAAEAYDASVDRLKNLLQGMGLPYDLMAPARIPSIDLTKYQLAIVAASASGQLEISPSIETALVAAVQDGVNLLWIGHGIWGSFRTTDLPDAFGVRYLKQAWSTDLGLPHAQFTNIAGKDERLTVHKEVVDKVEPTVANVLGWYLDGNGHASSIPFITEHRANAHAGRAVYVSLPLLDLWKDTEATDTYARAEVLYWHILRLTDAGIIGKHPVRDAKEGVLTLRLEDYTPGGSAIGHTVRPWLIRMERLLALVRDHDLPLNIALVPRYAHPFRNEHHDWASDDPGIATLRRQARQAFDDGGALVVHGYVHQNGRGPDDFSGDDWEMWDENAKRFLSLEEQRRITDLAFAEIARQWRITPAIWETPHYSSNADTYAAAAQSGFKYLTESDTKLFPNREGYLNRVGGLLLNIPETGFNYPLDPNEIKTSGIVKQRYILPRLVRLRAPFNFFYHNSSLQQERALKNLLVSSRRLDLWKPNLEEFGAFWEKRARVEVMSRLDPIAGRIVVELNRSFPGFALSIRLPDGAAPKTVAVDDQPVTAASRRVGRVWVLEPVMPGLPAHRVTIDYEMGRLESQQ
jgi:hypothetical protein